MSEGALEFRPYKPADRSRLQAIRRASFAPVFASFNALVGEEIGAVAFACADREQADLLDTLCDEAPHTPMLVALRNGEIVGFSSYSLDRATKLGEIGLNAVHPDHAGHGIGARLYETVLEKMRSEGMKAACVSTGADSSHNPARRAYEKAGFSHALPSVTLYRTL